ncbi:MAG: arylsulfatase [Kiritimatiellales bacterium]|nr:arylsulfatase [Kiritimatiellales bacterium]
MNRRIFLFVAVAAAIAAGGLGARGAETNQPNIVLIMADDLGWGDVSCNQPGIAYKTPNIDRLAKEGIRFTNAHAPHAVCTPTRYSLLTGRYCWRSFLREGVLPGYSRALIAPNRMTLATLLRQKGYQTAAFGKWHIGLDWQVIEGDPGDFHFGSQLHGPGAGKAIATVSQRVNHSAPIKGGPVDLGFDTFFGTPSNCTRIPVFIRDRNVIGSPARDKTGQMVDPELRRDTVDDRHVDEAIKNIEAVAKKENPFFVYLALNAIHGAVKCPHEFLGKTGISERTDKCLWLNKSVGRVLDTLDRLNLADDTLVIFTSDNGPFAARGNDLKKGHDASGPYRGFKTDAWDGGTRVPFIVRWPGKVKAGTTTDTLLCLTDIMATLAAVTGQPLPPWAGEDSFNQLPAWIGEETTPARDGMITQSYTGILAIRRGKWKLILDTLGSGGFPRYSLEVQQHATMSPWRPDMSEVGQLYDIEEDPYETDNVYEQHPELVQVLELQLRTYINDGRTRPL